VGRGEEKQKKTRNGKEKGKKKELTCLSRESLITLDILIVQRITIAYVSYVYAT